MPRVMSAPDDGTDRGDVIDLDALVDWCESADFDPRCEEGLAQAAPMLRALSRNRHFLSDLAVAELKTRCAGQRRANPYSAQVILLRPPTDRYVLRAAFWPAERDHVVRMSGPSAFLYHVPHDHSFDFLTVGHLGPGYASDYYEYDADGVMGADGEAVPLRFIERSCLSEGRMLLYRAHRDVHAQLPAESLSVSLNILASAPDQGWRRQYVERHRARGDRRVYDGVECAIAAGTGGRMRQRQCHRSGAGLCDAASGRRDAVDGVADGRDGDG